MKIPRRINAALDLAERHSRVIAATVVVGVALLSAPLLPAFAILIVGVGVGGIVVHVRMSSRLARLRAETDDLLRENGALRHQRTMLASGVIAIEGQQTAALPVIRHEERRVQPPNGPGMTNFTGVAATPPVPRHPAVPRNPAVAGNPAVSGIAGDSGQDPQATRKLQALPLDPE